MLKLVATVLAGIGAFASATASDSDETSLESIYAYAEAFAARGDSLRARIVYDLMLRAFSRADDMSNIERACAALTRNVPADSIQTLNDIYWVCPRSVLEDWLENLDAHAYREPKLIFAPGPIYPEPASGFEGSVDAIFDIEVTGRVINIRVVRSTNPIFEEPVIRVLSAWIYEPARRFGELEPVYNVQQRFTFIVEE